MRWLSQWRRGPIITLIVTWVVCTGTTLILYFIAEAKSTARMFADMGFRFGATSAQMHVNWGEIVPQLLLAFVLIVLLPPSVLLLLWIRARNRALEQ
ncbi:MAG: hypothetical protein ACJ796_22125 [Gemmatimonadaceae bacterium]